MGPRAEVGSTNVEQGAKGRRDGPGGAVSVTSTIADGHAPGTKRRTRGRRHRTGPGRGRGRASMSRWPGMPSGIHRRTGPIPSGCSSRRQRRRIEELVPIRYGRMLVSPFSYYRGAALPMTEDLASTPASGFDAQLCGDAHMSNFGVFGSPERHLFFDVNDFDETAPGPWEWDVKRLAASLEIAGTGERNFEEGTPPGSCRGRSGRTGRPA